MPRARPVRGRVFAIRRAKPHEAATLAALAAQLGYPSSPEEVERRLEAIGQDPEHAVFVAVSGGAVVAWLHGYVRRLVETDPSVEIGGLVVGEGHRAKGIGKLLM